jgi:hypothetical protein
MFCSRSGRASAVSVRMGQAPPPMSGKVSYKLCFSSRFQTDSVRFQLYRHKIRFVHASFRKYRVGKRLDYRFLWRRRTCWPPTRLSGASRASRLALLRSYRNFCSLTVSSPAQPADPFDCLSCCSGSRCSGPQEGRCPCRGCR